MFIAPNVYQANFWRLIAAIGWCTFFSFWLNIAILFKNKNKKVNIKIILLIYFPSLLFYVINLNYNPDMIFYHANTGWITHYPPEISVILFYVYVLIYVILQVQIFYKVSKISKLQRERKQARIIGLTTLISFIFGIITDIVLPILLKIKMIPLGIIGAPIGLIGIWYSIRKYKMLTIAPTPKYLAENLSEYLLKIVNDPIFVIGEDFLIKKANDIALELVGPDISEIRFDLLIENNDDLFSNLLKNGSINNAEVHFSKNNRELWEYDLSGKVIYDEFNDILGILIILHDISERKRTERILKEYNYQLKNEVNEKNRQLKEESFNRTSVENKIQYIGYHDELTGLSNRRYFNEFLTKLIDDIKDKEDEYFVIMFLDLDNFKLVNDTYGHKKGDTLLKHYASYIKNVIRENDLIARIGGDEFLILISNLSITNNENVVQILSNKIQNVFKAPFIIEDKENFITASIGIAQYPMDGKDAETLIMNADIAMYEAKNSGKNNVKICTQEIKNKMISKTILRNSLYKALSKKEISLCYQPQVNISQNKITGFEALLRWQLNNKEFISPNKFIPLAEETGLIVSIGYWVIATACVTLKKWHDRGYEYLNMAINLSVNQLNESNFVDIVKSIIKAHRINPSLLEFEVTERIMFKGNEVAERNLEELKKLGVKISIDDFGMEYSSFMNIKKLPIDKIKIAMEFIQELNINERDNVIVNSIIKLSHNLNLSVIAEGVETREQLEYLRYLECDTVQGYYFYKPLTDTEIESILELEGTMQKETLPTCRNGL